MENELPFDIARYLYGQWTERNYFSYICCNRQGYLLDWNEDIQRFYGLSLNKEQNIDEQLMCLLGFFPYEDDEICILDFVYFETRRTANIHIVPTDDSIYVLFFDATEAAKLRQELQQAHNEIHILYQQEKRSRQLLQKSNLQLQQQKAIAEEANQFKANFLKNVTHDLKNPLNSIMGFTQLLEASDPPLLSTQTESLKMIQKSSQYILHLIDDLLEATQIESGHFKIQLEAVNIATIIKNVLDLLRPLTDKNKIVFF